MPAHLHLPPEKEEDTVKFVVMTLEVRAALKCCASVRIGYVSSRKMKVLENQQVTEYGCAHLLAQLLWRQRQENCGFPACKDVPGYIARPCFNKPQAGKECLLLKSDSPDCTESFTLTTPPTGNQGGL